MERESHTARTDVPPNLPRLALRGGDWQKAGVNEEPPAKRRGLGNPWWWLLALFFGVCGYGMWRENAFQNAVREATEAGMEWECNDTISLIRQDWRNVLKKETWGAHDRVLDMGDVRDLGSYSEMLHRLRPTELFARGCNDENVDTMKGLTSLQYLDLNKCPSLQNVDGLKGLVGLKKLMLNGCTALQNVDGIKGLTGLQILGLKYCEALQNVDALNGLTDLQEIKLWGCAVLQNVDGLKGLTSLQSLDLSDCPELQNVDGLKSLTAAQWIDLQGCAKIPAAALRDLRDLRAALPNTYIKFPDGSKSPPQ